MAAEHARGEGVEGHVVRLVAAVADLGDEEVAHRPDRALGHRGTERDVGHQVEHLRASGGDSAVAAISQ